MEEKLQCKWPNLILQDPPGKRVALASPPGSGNTWVRHLIQLGTIHKLRSQDFEAFKPPSLIRWQVYYISLCSIVDI